MTNPEIKPLVSPWQLLGDIASWLPHKDQAIAERIIERHQRLHAAAKLGEHFDNRAAAIQTEGD